MNFLGHHLKLQEIQFIGEIKTISPVHIGAGRTTGLFEPTDLSVLKISRDGNDLPYIPGSSLKGLLRSACEAVIISIPQLKICNIVEYKDSCFYQYRKELENALNRKNNQEVLTILDKFCLICKIFGSSSYNSKIQIHDSYPLEEITTGIKKGIAIDRRTGSASRGALYDLEIIEPLNLFNFQMIFNNLPNYLVGLVAQTILEINNQNLYIGGMKSRGLGRVSITLKKIKVPLQSSKDKLLLKPLLEGDFPVILESLENPIKSEEFTKEILLKFVEAWEKYVAQLKK